MGAGTPAGVWWFQLHGRPSRAVSVKLQQLGSALAKTAAILHCRWLEWLWRLLGSLVVKAAGYLLISLSPMGTVAKGIPLGTQSSCGHSWAVVALVSDV